MNIKRTKSILSILILIVFIALSLTSCSQPKQSGPGPDTKTLYDFALLYSYRNIPLSDSKKVQELLTQLQYAKELSVDRMELITENEESLLRINYRMNLTPGQQYKVNHTKMMADAVVLFALLDHLSAVEYNLVQEDYSYGGVPITREQAEQVLGADIASLGKTEEAFLADMPELTAKLRWNPGVMDIITYEHMMGLDEQFPFYPSGPNFIKSIADKGGRVEITEDMRERFNLFARDYRWCYLPDMDGYESFLDTKRYADTSGHSNFAEAVFYVIHYMRCPEKMSSQAMQNAVQSLFVAKGSYQDMPHQAYFKAANYENGYYSPWPEGMPDFNRMFYLLTSLDVQQQGTGEVYITIRAKDYYFNDPDIYEAGENEKWLAAKAEELGTSDLQAAAQLLASGKMEGIEGSHEYETTLVVNLNGANPNGYNPRFLSNQSRYIAYDEPFAE